MFVYTLKASSIKFFGVVLLAVAVLVTIVTVIPDIDASGEVAAVVVDYDGIKEADDRISFLEQFGYEVEAAPVSETKVTIPEEFDSVYTSYNDLQRSQGLNLKKLQGKSVMKYTYRITNYEYEGEVLATLLVHKSKIVGGDVCSLQNGGFMHGFDKP